MSSLTSDNPLLSKPITADSRSFGNMRAINCTSAEEHLPGALEKITEFVRDSLAFNTRRAYASDIVGFERWGGAIPATPEMIASFLSAHAETHAAPTLLRWLSSLKKAHQAIGADDPTSTALVRSVLRGIRRRYGNPPNQASPLTRELLSEVLDAIEKGIKGKRDRALLLVGFAGGFRRSELVFLDVLDVAFVNEGLIITIRRSKSDQMGMGRKIGIPYAQGRHCPVKALRSWLHAADLKSGPLFRSVTRYGKATKSRLSGNTVSCLVKERVSRVLEESRGFSGHSLRAGFVTSAAKAGLASWVIRKQTGHASDAMISRYIRDIKMFENNAAGALL